MRRVLLLLAALTFVGVASGADNVQRESRTVVASVQDESSQKEAARLYYASDDVTLSVPDSCPDVHWRIVDWRGRTVRECATPEKSRVYAGRLPPGYWCVKADERTMTTLTVVVDPASRRRVETSPYGVDSALSWVGSPKHFSRRFDNSFRHVVWLMRAAGIVETRERLSWSETQKTADAACAWGFYRDNAEMCRKAVRGAVGRLVAAFVEKPLPEDAAAYERMKDLCASLKLPKEKMERIEAKPAPPSPGQEHQLLSLEPHGEIRRNSEGDLVGLKDGRILFMWSRMKGSTSDNAKSDICRRYLSRDGRTWTDDEAVFPTPEGSLNVMSVSLLRLASGKLALLYLHKRSERDCRPVYYTSSDEGATWSGPVTVIPDSRAGYYIVNNARLVQLKDGRLVVPAAKDGICHWLSDDEGRTWREAKGGAVRARKPNGDALRMEEPGTIELKDGRLMTYFRTDADWQYVTSSSDGGEHWTTPVPGNLRSPRSPATLERLKDGRIAVAWNDHETHPEHRFLYPYHNGGRTPLTLAFSSDEGRTWTDRLDIETEGWNCYTSLREIGGRLFVAYCYGGSLQFLRIAVFKLD